MSIKEYYKLPETHCVWDFDIIRDNFNDKVEVAVWDDGDIGFDFPDGNGYFLTLSELEEVVRRAKLFRDRRKVIK